MKVKVWNENTLDYKEEFRDKKIEIKAGQFIEMDDDEAVLFLGSFSPIKVGGDGEKLPESFKKLRIEYPGRVPYDLKEAKQNTCIGCGFEATSALELQGHIFQTHADQMADEDAKEELVKSVKRGPGRPPKEAQQG